MYSLSIVYLFVLLKMNMISLSNTAFTYLNYHCAISYNTKANPDKVAENYAGHKYYCEKQRQNTKTFGVLRSIFGEEMATKYIREMLFDYPEI